MDRVNGADFIDIGGGRRGFQGQNAAAGVPGTELTDAFLNGVQEEIMAVIEKAGLKAESGDWSQLWQALNRLNMPGYRGRHFWQAVISMDVKAPPTDALPGDAYLIPVDANGNWQDKAGQIAIRDDNGWIYIIPQDGHGIGLPDGRVFVRQSGSYVEYLSDKRIPLSQLNCAAFVPVLSAEQAAPSTPDEGDTYIVALKAIGLWKGKDGQLAEWTNKGWRFTKTPRGHVIGLPDGTLLTMSKNGYEPQLARDVQSCRWFMGKNGGTTDKLTAVLNPPVLEYADGLVIRLRVTAANKGEVTLDAGCGIKPVKRYDGNALQPGDLPPGGLAEFIFDAKRGIWQLCVLPVMIGAEKLYDKAGTYSFTVPDGITKVEVELWGGGGGSGACKGLVNTCGSTGGGGGYARKIITGLQPGQLIPLQVGTGGKAGIASPFAQPGGGGTSSFGNFVSATGGGAGQSTSGGLPNIVGVGGIGFGGDVTIIGGSGGLYWLSINGGVTVSAPGVAPYNPPSQPGSGNGDGSRGINSGDAGTAGVTDKNESHNGGAGADGKVIVRW